MKMAGVQIELINYTTKKIQIVAAFYNLLNRSIISNYFLTKSIDRKLSDMVSDYYNTMSQSFTEFGTEFGSTTVAADFLHIETDMQLLVNRKLT